MKRVAVAILISAFLSGCGDAQPVTTMPAKFGSTATATVLLPSPTPTPIISPPLASSLPPGDYLVVARLRSDAGGTPIPLLHVVSLDDKDMGLLASGVDMDAEPSRDMSRIAYWRCSTWSGCVLSILSLRDGSQSDIPGGFPNATGHAWSPAADQIMVDIDGRIELLDVSSGDRRLLLDCSEAFDGGDCFVKSWSPDGRWIAFAVDIARSGLPDPRSGLYLMDASCLADPAGCDGAIRGPLLPLFQVVAWSPDSRSIAAGFPRELVFFDLETWSQSRELPAEDVGSWHGLAWSPDGQWLAFSHNGMIWLLSATTGERRRVSPALPNVYAVAFWLTSPAADQQ